MSSVLVAPKCWPGPGHPACIAQSRPCLSACLLRTGMSPLIRGLPLLLRWRACLRGWPGPCAARQLVTGLQTSVT